MQRMLNCLSRSCHSSASTFQCACRLMKCCCRTASRGYHLLRLRKGVLAADHQQPSTSSRPLHSLPQQSFVSFLPLLDAPRISLLHPFVHCLSCIVSRLSMPSPPRRPSAAYTYAAAPSSSLLERLLQEINNIDAPRSDPVVSVTHGLNSRKYSLPSSSRRTSLNSTIPPPSHSSSNVWVKGGTIAEDARQKLRALDEARQRKLSVSDTSPPVHSMKIRGPGNIGMPSNDVVPEKTQSSSPSSLLFSDFTFDRTSTFAVVDMPSPTTDLYHDFLSKVCPLSESFLLT